MFIAGLSNLLERDNMAPLMLMSTFWLHCFCKKGFCAHCFGANSGCQ